MKKGLRFLLFGGVIVFGGIISLRTLYPHPLDGVGFSREVFAEKNELLRLTLSPDDKYRIFRPLEEISHEMIQAVLLSEDRHFYSHPGVNPISMFRAAASLGAERRIGGSTITMQMVRLKHRLYTRNLVGKIQQIFWAIGYEIVYSKKQILETYLNLTPYGSNIEGVEAASRIYFGKSALKINLLEAMTLAVIPQNPLKRSLNQTDLDKVTKARQILVKTWLEKNPQDKNIIAELQLPVLSNRISEMPFRAPHFVERALARNAMDHRVRTTLSWSLQKKIEETLESYLSSVQNRGVRNASVLLIDGDTREIKAWVGSGNYFDSEIQGQIDGITVRRSPGSTMKPFVFGLAMDEGLIHPRSLLKDTPSSYGSFDPENFDRRFMGPVTATDALIHSRNIPAIQLTSKLKRKSLYQVLQDVEVKNLRSEKTYGLGVTLGTAEVTPEDVGGMYTALYHLGEWAPLKWQQTSSNEESRRKRLMSQESSYLVLDMLTHSIRDTSSLVDEQMKSKYPMAWKTGTSYGFRDAWTAGVFGPYVLVVWLGNFDFSDNPSLIGRDMAAPLFFKIAEIFPQKVLADNGAWRNAFGLNLKKVNVCAVSGQLEGEHCPHSVKTWFTPGVSPIESCLLHRQIAVSQKTGQRLCGDSAEPFRRQVFEFWPSDLLEIFQKYGIRRQSPPNFPENCEFASEAHEGLSPEMTSPKRDMKYVISYHKTQMTEKIPLRAVSDGDVKTLRWFVNHQFVGKSVGNEALFYEAKPGRHEVIVIDDHGRSTSREVEVVVTR